MGEKSYRIICVCGAEFNTNAEWRAHYEQHGLNRYQPRPEVEKP